MFGYLSICRASALWERFYFALNEQTGVLTYSEEPASPPVGKIELVKGLVSKAFSGEKFNVSLEEGRKLYSLRAPDMKQCLVWVSAIAEVQGTPAAPFKSLLAMQPTTGPNLPGTPPGTFPTSLFGLLQGKPHSAPYEDPASSVATAAPEKKDNENRKGFQRRRPCAGLQESSQPQKDDIEDAGDDSDSEDEATTTVDHPLKRNPSERTEEDLSFELKPVKVYSRRPRPKPLQMVLPVSSKRGSPLWATESGLGGQNPHWVALSKQAGRSYSPASSSSVTDSPGPVVEANYPACDCMAVPW